MPFRDDGSYDDPFAILDAPAKRRADPKADAALARQAHGRVTTAVSQADIIVREYVRAANAARSAEYNPDGHLNDVGVANARDKAVENVKAEFGEKLRDLRAGVEVAGTQLQRIAGAEPLPDADEMARRGAHWRRAEALLNAGRLPSQVVRETAEPEALLAMRDELPTRFLVKAQSGGASDESAAREVDEHLTTIDERLMGMDHPAATYATARVGLAALDAVSRPLENAEGVIERGNTWLAHSLGLKR